jgi:hypothetical protein
MAPPTGIGVVHRAVQIGDTQDNGSPKPKSRTKKPTSTPTTKRRHPEARHPDLRSMCGPGVWRVD